MELNEEGLCADDAGKSEGGDTGGGDAGGMGGDTGEATEGDNTAA